MYGIVKILKKRYNVEQMSGVEVIDALLDIYKENRSSIYTLAKEILMQYNYHTNNNVSMDELISKDKHKRLMQPRHIITFILYEKYNYTDIGRLFNRTHATIRHAVLKIKSEIKFYPETKELVLKIAKDLKN